MALKTIPTEKRARVRKLKATPVNIEVTYR